MLAHIGVSPIAWSNDDLPELGGETSLETCLRETRLAGYTGIETGGKFPKSATELGPILREHALELVSGWYSGTLLDNSLADEKQQIMPQLELFRDLKAPLIVYGETAGSIQARRDVPLAKRRKLDDDTLKHYGEKLTDLAIFCQKEGVPLSFHHHMGTAIESAHDIERLMSATGPEVGLLFDTGHLVFAGAEPLAILSKFIDRINHVHTKDIRPDILQSIDRQSFSFLDCVLRGVFTVPGDGCIDYDPLIAALSQYGYQGWFVVEAEQDPKLAPPLVYAKKGYATLSQALLAAGYNVASS